MRAQWHSVDNAISRVPTAGHTNTIPEHLDTEVNSLFRCFEAITDPVLLQGYDAEGCGNNPTGGARIPGPPIFVWIKSNLAISRFEFPSPEPMALSSTR